MTRRRRALLQAVLLSALALAWPRPAAPARAAGSLDALADALVERVRPALERPAQLDVAVVVVAPWPRLAADLAQLVAGRLRALGVRSIEIRDAALDGAAGRDGFERLVRLELQAAGGRLRASGSVLAFASATWAPEPVARAHLYAEAALDDELRAYLPPPAPPPWAARALAVGDVDVRALDAGDLDGDGRAEVVAAGPSEAVAWALSPDGERMVEKWRLRLEGRPAALRPRADVVTVAIDGGAATVRASALADGVRRAGAATTPAHGFALRGVGTCELEPGVDWFAAASCGAHGEWPERFWTATALRGAHAARAAIVPPAPGSAASLWLWLQPNTPPTVIAGVGAQVALAVLERGEVVVTSEPVEPGEPDAIVIRALSGAAPVLHRIDRLTGGVRALAAADLDGDGRVEIVAAVRDDKQRRTELWVIR